MTPFLSLESANQRCRGDLRGIHRESLAGRQLLEEACATVAVAGGAPGTGRVGLRYVPGAAAFLSFSTTLDEAMTQKAEPRELRHALHHPGPMPNSFGVRHG